MTRSRLIYLLLIASLLAYFLACFRVPGLQHGNGIDGISDGGGLL